MDKNNLYFAFIMISCFLMVTTCIGPATSVDIDENDVPEKTVSIFIETDMSSEAAFTKLEGLLIDRGYAFIPGTEIRETVPENFTGAAEKWNADDSYIRLDISIDGSSDTVISIRGWFNAPTYDNLPGPVEEQIVKDAYSGPVAREAWIEMFEIARELDGYMRYESQENQENTNSE